MDACSIPRRCGMRRCRWTWAVASWFARRSAAPAFRVELSFGGLQTTSWVTDTGEVVREESPMGLLTVAETQERATCMAVPRQCSSTCWKRRPWCPGPDIASKIRATCSASASGWTAPTSRPGSPGCRPARRRRRDRDRRRALAARGPVSRPDSTGTCSQSPSSKATPEIRDEVVRRSTVSPAAAACRTPDPARERLARQEADRQPAVRARGPAHAGRRLQRAHRAVRGTGASCRHSGARHRGARRGAQRVLLPRVARGVRRRGQGPGSGCRSIPPSTSFLPTPRTFGWRAAGWTSRRVILPLIGRVVR